MSRVVHFEISADDPARAIAFYQNVFGWQASQWGEQAYWLLSTGPEGVPGIDGGLMPRGEGFPGIVNTIDVSDLEASIGAVESNGGKVMMRIPVEGVGNMAYCWDSEGNLFGMMQAAPNAAL